MTDTAFPETPKSKSPLAEFMARRRQELGLNQLQLSQVTGISSGTIASIESGNSQSPKAETLNKLAQGLRVSYHELDCIVRGVPYSAEAPISIDPIREFENYLLNHDKVPQAVAEILVEMVRKVIKKYD